VLLFLIAYVIIGLSALMASIFLPRRRNWARQVGILTTSLIVVMSVIATASGAGISIVGLLVPISAIVGLICLMSQQTKAWLHGVVRTD
jgi:Ca2+/Na+ antiporter